MSYSWGYEQTNVEFFKVLRVVGRCTVEIVRIASTMVRATGPMSEEVAPNPEAPIGQPFRARVRVGDALTGENFRHGHCGKWDGRPEYASHYA
jgi:hypothetical protein